MISEPRDRADRKAVLSVDDQVGVGRSLKRLLRGRGYDVEPVTTSEDALERLESNPAGFDVVLLDINMPRIDGIEMLHRIRRLAPHLPVIMLTGDRSTATATRALRAGAFNYLLKPAEVADLTAMLESACNYGELKRRAEELERQMSQRDHYEHLVGRSPEMRELFHRLERVARSEVGVLILGESGTGKELIARAIHQRSRRGSAPFVAINCGAIPETLIDSELFGHARGAFTGAVSSRAGVFVEADGGTLFLDEIGEMPLNVQTRLLRVLQQREVRAIGAEGGTQIDVRVIAATHSDLHGAVEEKRFRADLFYRLNVLSLRVPPLRHRIDDVPLLASHFLHKHAVEHGWTAPRLTHEAVEVLTSYSWPGNVRQLENALQHGMALADHEIDVRHLPRSIVEAAERELAPADNQSRAAAIEDPSWMDEVPFPEAKKRAQRNFERQYVLRMLERSEGNIAQAARLAGLDRSNFRRVMNRAGVDPDEIRSD